jgi:hypothetical protein
MVFQWFSLIFRCLRAPGTETSSNFGEKRLREARHVAKIAKRSEKVRKKGGKRRPMGGQGAVKGEKNH